MRQKPVPASQRINNNKLLLVLSLNEVQAWLKEMRKTFLLEKRLNPDPESVARWTTWLLEEGAGRWDSWNEKIDRFLKEKKLPKKIRGVVESVIKFGTDVIPLESNARISSAAKSPDLISIELSGPVSKREWDQIYNFVNSIMSSVIKKKWDEPIRNKADHSEAFRYYWRWRNMEPIKTSTGEVLGKSMERLVEGSELSDAEFERELARIQKLIQRFEKELKKLEKETGQQR